MNPYNIGQGDIFGACGPIIVETPAEHVIEHCSSTTWSQSFKGKIDLIIHGNLEDINVLV